MSANEQAKQSFLMGIGFYNPVLKSLKSEKRFLYEIGTDMSDLKEILDSTSWKDCENYKLEIDYIYNKVMSWEKLPEWMTLPEYRDIVAILELLKGFIAKITVARKGMEFYF